MKIASRCRTSRARRPACFPRCVSTCLVHAAPLDGAKLKQREALTRDGTSAALRVDLEKSRHSSLYTSRSTSLSDTGRKLKKKLVCSLGPVCKTERHLMVRALISAVKVAVLIATSYLFRQPHGRVNSTGAKIHVQDVVSKADDAMWRCILCL